MHEERKKLLTAYGENRKINGSAKVIHGDLTGPKKRFEVDS